MCILPRADNEKLVDTTERAAVLVRYPFLIKVLVVDDHELVRSGISRILADQNGIEVIGEASSGEEAVQFTKETPPDIVLMDIRMPGIGGWKPRVRFCVTIRMFT